jgi:hypothetical protein
VKKLSIIIVNYNTCELLLDCLRSIVAAGPRIPYDVIVVDNGSKDGSVAAVAAEFPGVMLIANPTNRGFSAANNQALRQSTGDYVLLLNSDAKLTEGTVEDLIQFLEKNPEAAAAGPMLLNEDGTFQRSFFPFPSAGKTFLHILAIDRWVLRILKLRALKSLASRMGALRLYTRDPDERAPQKVAYLLFACILLRRDVLERIGLFDEELFFYHDDCEFGYRLAKAGLGVWWVPSSRVVHVGGGSSRSVPRESFRHFYESLLHVFKKHQFRMANLALRMAIFVGFVARAGFTPLGAYKSLDIPSTYGDDRSRPSQAFGPAWDRLCYYASLAALAWRR